jgi:hypothetical protein
MLPDGSSPARVLASLECRMHELMLDMAVADRWVDAAACRAELVWVSLRRAAAAEAEALNPERKVA